MRNRGSVWIRIALVAAVAVAIPACESSSGDDAGAILNHVFGGGGTTTAGGGGGGPILPGLQNIPESEPNNTTATADALAFGVPYSGSLSAADVDWWTFTVSANTALTIEMFGHRREQGEWSVVGTTPDVTLMASDGFTVINQDGNHNLGDTDIPGTWVVPGTYFIRVQTAALNFPGAGYVLLVSTVAAQFETEPIGGFTNDTFLTAEPVNQAGGATSGVVAGDRFTNTFDVYSISIPANGWLRARIVAHQNSALYDSRLDFLAQDGTTLIHVIDDGMMFDGMGSRAYVTAGTYYLRMNSFSNGTGGAGRYFIIWSILPAPVLELEPNDSTLNAQPIQYGDHVRGSLSSTADFDFYSFTAAAGDQIMFEQCDGALASFVAPLGIASTPSGVTTTSYLTAKMEGAIGSVTPLLMMSDGFSSLPIGQVTGIGATNIVSRNSIIQTAGTYYIRITPGTASAYAFRLQLVRSSTFETEPNNTPATAQALPVAAPRMTGVHGTVGDVDVFSFTAAANEFVVLRLIGPTSATSWSLWAQGHGSVSIPLMTVIGTDQNTVLAMSTRNTTVARRAQGLKVYDAAVEVAFIAPAAGTYYLSVADASGLSGTTRYYMVSRE